MKVISPDLFSQAVYYSIWYGNTLKVKQEVFPPFSAREKKEILLDHVDYLSRKRQSTNQKRVQARRKTQADKLDKKQRIKKTDNYIIREKFKKLESKNYELNTFLTKIFSFKFKDMIDVDPLDESTVDNATNSLWDLYKASFPIVFNEANKRKLKDHRNKFMVKILMGHFDEKENLIKDKVLKTFDIEEEERAVAYARRKRNVDIVVKSVYNKKLDEYVEKLFVIQKNVEDTPYEDMFDLSAIGTFRFQAFEEDEGDLWFNELLKQFKKKSEEYLARSYAAKGAIAGLNIEYIYDYNLK
jgi:hypothetical protein